MSEQRHCHYCGWRGAKVRRPGEPATCWSCRDLPAKERAAERGLERSIDLYYNGRRSPRS